MAPFDRSRTSFYSSSIVTMAVSCTVFEIKRYIDRKSWSQCSRLLPIYDDLAATDLVDLRPWFL